MVSSFLYLSPFIDGGRKKKFPAPIYGFYRTTKILEFIPSLHAPLTSPGLCLSYPLRALRNPGPW